MSPVRKQLFEERSGGRLVTGWVTADAGAALVDCHTMSNPWKEATAEMLAGILADHGVVHGVDRAALEEVAGLAREGRSCSGRAVARGTPPEPGRDGALEFIVRPSGEPRHRGDGLSDRVDYRETNIIENVLAGEPVAIELPPRPGRDGVDVLGRAVRAAEGKPAVYRLGAGVRFDAESRQVLAEIDGRVVWDSGTVSVSRTFRVTGPVDYSVGNIAFVGDVVIDGDVLDGFSVRTGGDLTVGGSVGACTLDCEGNLTVHGGVHGKGRARLRSGGSLSARFLNDCQAESAGDMTLERESVGSTLMTNGALLITAGRLVGGSASALGGVDAGVLGSPLGVPTTVSAGSDYTLARRQAETEARVAEVDASADKISSFLGPLLADRRRMSQLVSRRRGDLERLVVALRNLGAERTELAARLEELAESSHRGAVRQISVRKEMHPGVLLELGSVRHRVKEPAAGPLSVVLDKAQGSLRNREFSSLAGAPGGKPGGGADDAASGAET